MSHSLLLIAVLAIGQTEPLGAGDHKRSITVDDVKRVHWIHVPAKYDAKKPTSVVIALHGASMYDKMMEYMTGLSQCADGHNFIIVYPNGTGLLQTWNAGQFPGKLARNNSDDIKYLGKVLDDVEGVCNVDKKRVYVTGLSNGGMMAYRVAAEMPERVAAIASVAGTLALEKYEPKRPVPVLHFHGTADPLVPYNGPDRNLDPTKILGFRSVDDTIQACLKANGCGKDPTETMIEPKLDKIKVTRKDYGKGKDGAEVVLYVLEKGGHVWPGSLLSPAFLGPSTLNISSNELMWEFFSRHALK